MEKAPVGFYEFSKDEGLNFQLNRFFQWEKCTSAVLDYYNLNDVTLIGISLGGYLATRAAAYEKRITRLVMYDLIYDFYGSLTARMGKKKEKFFNWMMKSPQIIIVRSAIWDSFLIRWKSGLAVIPNRMVSIS